MWFRDKALTPCALLLKVKTSKVFIRDCTLIHPLTLLLFAGKSLTVISEGRSEWIGERERGGVVRVF